MPSVLALIRRLGLTVLLVGALVSLFTATTLPSLRERDRARTARARAEDDVAWRRRAAQQRELWIRGATEDAFVQERLLDVLERSPELPGPRLVSLPVPLEGPDEEP